MTGKPLRIYTDNPEAAPLAAPKLPPGFALVAAHQDHAHLMRLSAELRHDWCEVIQMPRYLLLTRHFSAFVLGRARAAGMGSGFTFPPSYLPAVVPALPPRAATKSRMKPSQSPQSRNGNEAWEVAVPGVALSGCASTGLAQVGVKTKLKPAKPKKRRVNLKRMKAAVEEISPKDHYTLT